MVADQEMLAQEAGSVAVAEEGPLPCLPSNWRIAKLDEVARYINGYAFKPSDWGSRGKPIIRIQNLNDSSKPYNYFQGEVDSRYRVQAGDVLISWSASLGAYLWSGPDAWLNQHIFKAIINEAVVDRRFFFWVMKKEINRIAEFAHGSTMKHVTQNVFLNSEIPLPPLCEQRAIARVLNALQDAIQARRREIELERERKAALMQHLFTCGTRGEPTKVTEIGEMPQSWRVVPLRLAVSVFDRLRVPLNETQRQSMPGPFPYCGANGVLDYVNDFLFDGDFILLAEDGGYWGPFESSAYEMTGRFWVNNHAHVLQAKRESADNRFLCYQLNFLDIARFISGTTRGKLTQGVMQELLVALPELSEQRQIAGALTACDGVIELLLVEIELLDELFRTLLQELMTGRLSAVQLVETEAGVPV